MVTKNTPPFENNSVEKSAWDKDQLTLRNIQRTLHQKIARNSTLPHMPIDIFRRQSTRCSKLSHTAGLRLRDHRERNCLGSVSAQVKTDRSIDLLAALSDRSPQLRSNLAHQQRTPMARSQQPQIPGTQRQQYCQQLSVLFVTVSHQNHSVAKSNCPSFHGGRGNHDHTRRLWKSFGPG